VIEPDMHSTALVAVDVPHCLSVNPGAFRKATSSQQPKLDDRFERY
jgi:hypothetical protein